MVTLKHVSTHCLYGQRDAEGSVSLAVQPLESAAVLERARSDPRRIRWNHNLLNQITPFKRGSGDRPVKGNVHLTKGFGDVVTIVHAVAIVLIGIALLLGCKNMGVILCGFIAENITQSTIVSVGRSGRANKRQSNLCQLAFLEGADTNARHAVGNNELGNGYVQEGITTDRRK